VIDLLITLAFLVLFLAPEIICLRGRLARRYAALAILALIFGSAIGLGAVASLATGGNLIGTFWASCIGDWTFATSLFLCAAPAAWYLARHSGGLKSAATLFAAAFDPRLAGAKPPSRLARNKILTGTKAPTGSRRFLALRDKLRAGITGKR